jgi:putative transposase
MKKTQKNINCNVLKLLHSQKNHEILQTIGIRVSKLWNAANYICRQNYINKKPVPGYSKLCSIIPKLYPEDYKALPSDIAQEVLKKLSEAWQSYFALLKRFVSGQLKHRPGLIKYRKFKSYGKKQLNKSINKEPININSDEKTQDSSNIKPPVVIDRKEDLKKDRKIWPCDYIPIKNDRSASLNKKEFTLTLPADLRKQGRFTAVYSGKIRFSGKIGRIELMYDRCKQHWYIKQSVTMKDKIYRQFNGRIAGIDLGIRITASLSLLGQSHARLYSGRNLLKEYNYWTRQISEHQKQLSTRKLKTSKRLVQLYRTRKDRLEHALKGLAKSLASVCKASNVTEVLIGWPKGIREDVTVRKDFRGTLHNYWSFDRLSNILVNALKKVGIRSQRVGERGTSSTCPWSLNKKHKLSRNPRYKIYCKDCDKSMHSDACGSLNMMYLNKELMKDKSPEIDWDAAKTVAVPYVQEWNSHNWTYRTKSLNTNKIVVKPA